VTIAFTGKPEMAFANYWQKLIAAGDVAHIADLDPQWFNELDNETIASWTGTPAWGVQGLGLFMKKSFGDWTAAPLPEASPGAHLEGSWGGSTMAVLAATKYPTQAAEFAKWFAGTLTSWDIMANPKISTAVPAYKPLLDSPAYENSSVPNQGSQKSLALYNTITPYVVAPQWPPFTEEVLTQISSATAGVIEGTETVSASFQTLQNTLVNYAKSEGFSVSE
jgi:multiple sugar transport system substrate-binding protein